MQRLGLDCPILYSFRRCPYAMRARLALVASGVTVELREVVLRHKPAQLLQISPKGTVPVLQLVDGQVIEQSLEIMQWALQQSDPRGWLRAAADSEQQALIEHNDHSFKRHLDHYKYADRYPEHSASVYRAQAEGFIAELESRLSQHAYLCGAQASLADVAIFPFIRQFAQVDRVWFDQADYPYVQAWLAQWLSSALFESIMCKYAPWHEGEQGVLFLAV